MHRLFGCRDHESGIRGLVNNFQTADARNQRPAPRDRHPGRPSRWSQWIVLLFLVLLGGFLATPGAAGSNAKTPSDEFMDVIRTLASLGDRSTGTPGNAAAGAYILERFAELGFEDVGAHQFSVPVIRHGQSTLTFLSRDLTIPIHPVRANAITPQTIPPPGVSGPLVYVGAGELADFNGKLIAGAIVLMELESGKNWLHAANLGAQALIYVDRGSSSKMFFEEKRELSPIQFPRFWMSLSEARAHFGTFETLPEGSVAAEIRLVSEMTWQNVTAENIYCLIPGTDPKLGEELVMVDAFYDSTAFVPGLSPGADEACGVATLLASARLLKRHPPQRSVLLVATGGHAQALAGMRELVWSLSARSKDLRDSKRALKALISETRQTIRALSEPSFESAAQAESGEEQAGRAFKEALDERVKTEADSVSRHLMRLRLQTEDEVDPNVIKQLAQERQALRRLLWRTDFKDLPLEEREILARLVPKALQDQRAILTDAKIQLEQVESARNFRGQVKAFDLVAAVSLHLSSHGDGFGAFNYGWLYPFRPRINRVAAYSELDEVLRQGARQLEQAEGLSGLFQDTLRPSRRASWQSYFLDRPPLGGEVTALAGYHGISLVTTYDARPTWGTPYDTAEKLNIAYALKQSALVCGLIRHLAQAPKWNADIYPRNGFSDLTGRAKFLRHGELFADQPAPGTVLLAYQGPARYHVMVDHLGEFQIRGVADSKHSFHKVILEGYKFDPLTGSVIWTIDKKQTGKDAYRVKMQRRFMETDLVMFACNGTTLFNLLEPRTFRYLTKPNVIDGRREADPLRWFMSRLDTWSSVITSIFLEAGTPLKMTLSDTILRNKLVLLNATENKPEGAGYMVEKWPFLHMTEFRVARDMWTLLGPRIANLEARGIFNDRIRRLEQEGLAALETAETALANKRYDRFSEASARSWALASRVYEDVEKTQKDVLYGVLFYIALFVPFAFCLERLLFSYSDIYKRIIAFCTILILLIALIYNVHPAFQLAYSPMVVILAFFIMGLSLMVTLIIFFRFEEEMTRLQTRAQLAQAGEIGRWKAFVAAFLLGVSNLRRRRLRTALTCATLVILTFTIMSFTSVKSMRHHARLLFQRSAPYQGFLLKNFNWQNLPPEALGIISNAFAGQGLTVPRVWLEDEDKTRAPRIPVRFEDQVFEAQGLVGLSHAEAQVSGLDDILVGGRWLAADERQAVLLPERLARKLGIDPGRLQGTTVTLWGMPFDVVGVFAGSKLQNRLDLDGEPLTPVTFPREVTTELTEVEVEALESGEDVQEFQSQYQHISGDLTLIIPYRTLLAAGGHLKGVAIRPQPATSIQTSAQNLVDRFGLSLFSGEPDGTYLYHASDTMSYSGVPNILIPLVISVFIVLNTMIGSVYERKREIGIYTSVGLAPSHVSFLFIAEALALAVLSVVLGYLLAQTTAKLFAATSLWAGITVNYSSWAGVAAMLLVIIVVLVSVIYPSKVAGEIAIPDVNRSWTLPESQGNELELTLPFLMRYREHRSVGGYLYDYFQGHQDVSHGMFSTGNIEFGFVCHVAPGISEVENTCPEQECEFEACLQVSSSVWLAPFDFGIMQQVELAFLPAGGEPGFLEIRVRLIRESGEANAWHRINKTFLHQIRRQLLVWRSFDLASKAHYEHLLAEAEQELGASSDQKETKDDTNPPEFQNPGCIAKG
ncbi:MAG: M28 family peptidase [Desulfobacterales bacterium]|nr:MAG: M28 family peptidase [Desulfobacterales bacterium]